MQYYKSAVEELQRDQALVAVAEEGEEEEEVNSRQLDRAGRPAGGGVGGWEESEGLLLGREESLSQGA